MESRRNREVENGQDAERSYGNIGALCEEKFVKLILRLLDALLSPITIILIGIVHLWYYLIRFMFWLSYLGTPRTVGSWKDQK